MSAIFAIESNQILEFFHKSNLRIEEASSVLNDWLQDYWHINNQTKLVSMDGEGYDGDEG